MGEAAHTSEALRHAKKSSPAEKMRGEMNDAPTLDDDEFDGGGVWESVAQVFCGWLMKGFGRDGEGDEVAWKGIADGKGWLGRGGDEKS